MRRCILDVFAPGSFTAVHGCLVLWLVGLAAAGSEPPATQVKQAGPTPNLSRASWIWSSRQALTSSNDSCLFRKKFALPARPKQATIVLTADNGFDLYVNGQYIAGEGGAEGSIWQSVERFRIEQHLLQGANVIAVRAENLGGPGGLVAAVHMLLPDGHHLELVTDQSWLVTDTPRPGWTESDHDDSTWSPAVVLAKMGMKPWGPLAVPERLSRLGQRTGSLGQFSEPGPDYPWPAGVVFVSGRAPLSSTPGAPQATWPIQGSRAFFEHDTPAPPAVGHRLYALVPARPDARPRLLVDAGRGLIGSPACSYDGQEVFFAMAPEGEKYFKLFRVMADGSGLQRLTYGPWHDYHPAPLPDGRIVFTSTRVGSRDEYHGNTARSLFVLSADRSSVRPLTYHIVGDNEPAVMADGRICFVRCDNFMERAKVETHIHAIRPDGTGGQVLVGPNRGPIGYDRLTGAEEQSRWLRSYGFGSPAPLPDGRLICLSYIGPVALPLSRSGPQPVAAVQGKEPAADPTPRPWDKVPVPCDVALFDISPLPDGRLLCSTRRRGALGILDPADGKVVMLYQTDTYDLHSVTYLGPRPKPPVLASQLPTNATDGTGFLICKNVYQSKQTAADWPRVKAVRVFMGKPLTTRSAHHPYDHIGVEGIELGTVPLAPDGSFYVRVPADRALAIQAVDAEGRPVVNELSWIYVRPGERRTCNGCHSRPQSSPGSPGPLAVRFPPIDLLPHAGTHRFRANNAANGGVLNLQFDRFREVASIDLYRQPAVAAGYDTRQLPAGRPTELRRLCQVLTKDQGKRVGADSLPDYATSRRAAERKIAAAQRLALLRDRAAVPALVQALGDSDPDVPMNAALALAACGNRQAVEPLLKALAAPNPAAAQAAHLALEHLTGHSEPFNAYAGRHEQQRGQRQWQVWLRHNDWATVERDLVRRMGSSDPIEVHLAIEALGHVGGRQAAESLRQFVARLHGAKPMPALVTRLAAIRALGYLKDQAAVPVLAELLEANIAETPVKPAKSHEFGWAQEPVHLAGAAAEALGRIGTPDAERRLIAAFAHLAPFWYYTYRSGDHEWLKGCHSSIPHYRILEALDAMGSQAAGPVVADILRSVPMDPDRALLYENDAYETVSARVIHRSGLADRVIEACFAVLERAGQTARAGSGASGRPATGPPAASTPGAARRSSGAARAEELIAAVSASPPAVSVGPLSPPARAAHLLSVVCLSPKRAPRLRAAFEHWHHLPPSRKRSWVCFFLARTLGKLRDRAAVPLLVAAVMQDATEASFGQPDPPNVFLHNAMTPLYRAAAADALGRIGDRRAVPALLRAVADFDNAMDVRQAAARALAMIADPSSLPELKKLARSYPEVATRRTLQQACAAVEQGRR